MAYSLNTYYYIAPVSQPSKYLNRLGNGAPADNQDVTLYVPLGSPDQRWKVELAGDGGILLNALNDSYGLTSTNRFALNIWRGATKYNKCDIVKLANNTAKDYVVNLETHDGGQNIYRICIMGYGLYMTARSDGSVYWEAKKGTGTSNDQLWKLSTTQSGGESGGIGLSFRCPLASYTTDWNNYEGPGSGQHRGTDYAAAKGTPIYAAGYGKVLRVYGWQGTTTGTSVDTIGNAVFIEHYNANGTTCGMTRYFHMREKSTAVSAGNYVNEGQLIGYVGNTGKVTAITGDGSHLHFEVKTGSNFDNSTATTLYNAGTWVNPKSYIKR